MKHLISSIKPVRGKFPTVQFKVTILDDNDVALWDIFGFRYDARRKLKFPRNRTMQNTYFDSCSASDEVTHQILVKLQEHKEIQEFLGPAEKYEKKKKPSKEFEEVKV